MPRTITAMSCSRRTAGKEKYRRAFAAVAYSYPLYEFLLSRLKHSISMSPRVRTYPVTGGHYFLGLVLLARGERKFLTALA